MWGGQFRHGLLEKSLIYVCNLFGWSVVEISGKDPPGLPSYSYYLSNSKTFQDGNGNGNAGKLMQKMTFKMAIGNQWK